MMNVVKIELTRALYARYEYSIRIAGQLVGNLTKGTGANAGGTEWLGRLKGKRVAFPGNLTKAEVTRKIGEIPPDCSTCKDRRIVVTGMNYNLCPDCRTT